MLVSRRIEQLLQQLLHNKKENERALEETVVPLLRLAAVLTALSAPLLAAVLQQADKTASLESHPTAPQRGTRS